jgi:hypothetical protein
VTQVIECPSIEYKAQNSNPSTTKNKKERNVEGPSSFLSLQKLVIRYNGITVSIQRWTGYSGGVWVRGKVTFCCTGRVN